MKADEKQRNKLTDEEFKKLPKPNEVIKIAHGPVVTKKNEIKLTVLQKFSQLLKTYQCSGQLQSTKVWWILKYVVYLQCCAIENHQDPVYVVNWHFSRGPDKC